MSVTDELLANNQRYAETFRGPLPLPPGRGVAVIACMDARLNVYAILGLAEGEAHVIRNAGGVVTDDEIRSLAISQRLLGTREIILIHHTDCGMLTFTDDDFKAAIQADTGIKPPWAAEAFADLDTDVRQSIARIKASPFIPHTDAVRGFVFDVATGKLHEVEAELPSAGGRVRRRGSRLGPAARRGTARTARRVPRRSACSPARRPACRRRRSAANASYCCSRAWTTSETSSEPFDLPGDLQVGPVRRLAQRVGGQGQAGGPLHRLEQRDRRRRVGGLGEIVRHVHREPDRRAPLLAHPQLEQRGRAARHLQPVDQRPVPLDQLGAGSRAR